MSYQGDTNLSKLTASFIGAIANGLSQHISAARQKELVAKPEELRRLLLPLANDEWVRISPILLNEGFTQRLVWLDAFTDIQQRNSGTPILLSKVIETAKERCLQFLGEERAEELARLMYQEDPSYRSLTGRADQFVFPFTKNKKILMWNAYASKRECELTTASASDEMIFHASGAMFFFHPGTSESMDSQCWS